MKLLGLFLCLSLYASTFAQMPRTLNYQGTLATGSTPVPDGNYNVMFRLYMASSGGSAVWTEAQLVAALLFMKRRKRANLERQLRRVRAHLYVPSCLSQCSRNPSKSPIEVTV